MRTAILDLGSNSFHVLVADVDDREAARAAVAHLADRARGPEAA